MPTIITRGAATAQGFGWTIASLGAGYWIGTLSKSATDATGYGVFFDASGNIISGGGASGNQTLVKLSPAGAITWQKKTGFGYYYKYAFDMGSGYTGASILAPGNVSILKHSSSDGSLSWAKGFNAYGNAYPGSVTSDNSSGIFVSWGDSYVACPCPCSYTSYSFVYFARFDSTGALSWCKQIQGYTSANPGGAAYDASGNLYAGAFGLNGSNSYNIIKFSSGGSVTWQKSYTLSGYATLNKTIAVSSAGDVYNGGTVGTSPNKTYIIKLNSSGSLQWSRTIGTSSELIIENSAVDSSGNYYVVGWVNPYPSPIYGWVVKYNSSGVIQWQRKITRSSYVFIYGISIKDNTMILNGATGPSSGVSSALMLQLPTDGSKTGTYTVGGVAYTYTAGTFTDASSSFTEATTSNTISTASPTVSTLSLTVSDPALTSTVVTI